MVSARKDPESPGADDRLSQRCARSAHKRRSVACKATLIKNERGGSTSAKSVELLRVGVPSNRGSHCFSGLTPDLAAALCRPGPRYALAAPIKRAKATPPTANRPGRIANQGPAAASAPVAPRAI